MYSPTILNVSPMTINIFNTLFSCKVFILCVFNVTFHLTTDTFGIILLVCNIAMKWMGLLAFLFHHNIWSLSLQRWGEASTCIITTLKLPHSVMLEAGNKLISLLWLWHLSMLSKCSVSIISFSCAADKIFKCRIYNKTFKSLTNIWPVRWLTSAH